MDIVSDATCEAASSDKIIIPDPQGVCRTMAGDYNNKISEDMVCAGVQGKGACQGDSGGPLTVKSGASQHQLVGVVSWGYGCGVVSILYLLPCILYPVSCIFYPVSCIMYLVFFYHISCILYPVSS